MSAFDILIPNEYFEGEIVQLLPHRRPPYDWASERDDEA